MHRDINPNNVLIFRDEARNLQVKLIDFNVATSLKCHKTGDKKNYFEPTG